MSRRRFLSATALLIGFCQATQSLAAGIDRAYEGAGHGALSNWLERMVGDGKSYAVLIGISEYAGGFRPLPAASDVERMRRFLIENAGFDTVYVLTEEKATKSRIEELMEDILPSLVNSRDRVLVYWSGHGLARQLEGSRVDGYLPLRLSQRNSFSSMVSMADIRRWSQLLKSRQSLYVIDACVSGLAGQQSKSSLTTLTIDQLNQPARHLLAAGTSGEETIAGDRWGGSLFTDAFIRGASGAAANGSQVIGVSQLLTYVRRYVATERDYAGWTKTITPQLRDLGVSDGEFYFVLARGAIAPKPSLIPSPNPMPPMSSPPVRKGINLPDGCSDIGGNVICPDPAGVRAADDCVDIGGNLICPDK